MTLEDELAQWNGKVVEVVDDIYSRHAEAPDFAQRLVAGLEQVDIQRGASWLLKHFFENGGALDANQISTAYATLPHLAHWETKLHILQSMPYMPIGENDLEAVEPFLKAALNDKKKFVKAWAYNGYHLLAQQHEGFRVEVDLLLQKGLVDESGSIKARIRNILKGK